jgi:glycosyltransferase involved in cell wall biosynthesis
VPNNLRFTVVVPTRDRPRPLARCLAAVEAQDVDGDWEIVVVDDGSRAADEVATVVAATGRARLVRTAPAGSVQARNRGAREARAPVLLFLDDDCEPQAGWATALVSAVEQGAPAAAGKCVNADPADALAGATQTVLDFITLDSLLPDGSTRFAPTYNVACRRDLLLAVPFEESYVNQGADRDWCARLTARGFSIAFEPTAVAVHRQKLDLGSFWRKHREYGSGSGRFHRRHGIGLERPRFYTGLLRAGFRHGPRTGLAVLLAQLATAVGFARQALARR